MQALPLLRTSPIGLLPNRTKALDVDVVGNQASL